MKTPRLSILKTAFREVTPKALTKYEMSQNYVRNRFGFSVLEIDVNDLESVIFLGSGVKRMETRFSIPWEKSVFHQSI